MSTAETRRVIAGHVAALQRGDAHSRRASFIPKASWTIRGDIPVAGTWTGPGEILDGFRSDTAIRRHQALVNCAFS